jgi:general secretion pathway protein D
MSGRQKQAGKERMSLTRRALLKTTTFALVGWIALALVLSTRDAAAGPSNGTSEARLVAAILGQSNAADNPPADPRQRSADLLRRARQAMAEKDFVAAESLISQADTLGVKYNIFYQGDTPEKARRELDRRRNSVSPAKPNGLFAPLSAGEDKAPTSDPFAAHPIDPPTAGQQVTPLPRIDYASPIGAAQAEGTTRTPGVASQAANRSSNNPLRTARLALAVGDLRRATEFVQRARALRINYQPLEDTPDKVEAAIRRQQELQGLDKSTEAYARVYSRALMEQADGLLRLNEYDEADRLARLASSLRIDYGPFEQKPQEMIQRIASARRQDRGAAAGEAPGYASASAGGTGLVSRQRAVELVRQARDAIDAGRFDQADTIARRAQQLAPSTAFAPGEDCPDLVLLDLQRLKQRAPSAVVPAGGQYADQTDANRAMPAYYTSTGDQTQNVQASNTEPGVPPNQDVAPGSRYAQIPPPIPTNPMRPAELPRPEGSGPTQSQGVALFQQGEAALRAHDTTRAYELFRQAANYQNELDPETSRRLHDHLQLLAGPGRTNPSNLAGQAPSMANQAASQQQLLINQIRTELAHRESNARAMRATDPKGALANLEETRKKVEMTAGLDPAVRDQFLRSVDRAIAETKQVIAQNRPQIELNDKNNRIRQDVERQQRVKVEVQTKLALMIDQYNRLIEEQRYAEAEVTTASA